MTFGLFSSLSLTTQQRKEKKTFVQLGRERLAKYGEREKVCVHVCHRHHMVCVTVCAVCGCAHLPKALLLSRLDYSKATLNIHAPVLYKASQVCS